jgi:hypothetical protein
LWNRKRKVTTQGSLTNDALAILDVEVLFEDRVKLFQIFRPSDGSRGHLDGVVVALLDLYDLLIGVISSLEAWSGTLAQDLRLREGCDVDWGCKSSDGQSRQDHDAFEKHGDKCMLYVVDLSFVLSSD